MNYSSYFAIAKKVLKEQGIELDRADLVREYTDQKKDGLTQLTAKEYEGFIQWMTETYTDDTPKKDASNTMRRKIIALFRKMGYVKNGEADMDRIYAWVKQSGYLHKPLNGYNMDELPKLVYQANQVYKSFVKAV